MIRKTLLILAVAAVPVAFVTIQIVSGANSIQQHSRLEIQSSQLRQSHENARADQLDHQAQDAAVAGGTHLFLALVSLGVAVYVGTRKKTPAKTHEGPN
jgi:hypothetical protein